jgi:hypothetical protein
MSTLDGRAARCAGMRVVVVECEWQDGRVELDDEPCFNFATSRAQSWRHASCTSTAVAAVTADDSAECHARGRCARVGWAPNI